ncbi:RND efflux system, membrane fusion protein CmeA [Hyphomicrobium sulfonivorans]|uniref:RND efflux system, membrane fusion protein CmeA n=2 Tax=Hyphomicrobium sulfonivorans TaxID=121290 RepID=A0A125NWJ0_HYPSL|nr:RND efflux system, membrane fusion protein CmeA [Hyphomicrobium sulfonivorans]
MRSAALLFIAAMSSSIATAVAEEPAMPPTAVGTVVLEARTVPVVRELPGRIAATRVAHVRAQVSGVLQERVFEQGALVNEGDVLYRIDPKLFRVRVASAEANLLRAKAVQTNAHQHHKRQKELRARDVSSAANLDSAAAAAAQADADVALAEAGLEEAKINLAYTEIRAPITGIIGGALVTEGALVSVADSGENLAIIQQIDPVYADFTQSSSELLSLKRAVAEGTLVSPAAGQARVNLILEDGTVYADAGRLLFSSASVDATTGQVTLRAEFPNPNRDLLPGLYVRVHIEQALKGNAITVPQRSILRGQDGTAQVYVLLPGEVIEARDVKLGSAVDGEWIVEAGLQAGERIVVDGAQKVKPGDKVVAEPWKPIRNAVSASEDTNKQVAR